MIFHNKKSKINRLTLCNVSSSHESFSYHKKKEQRSKTVDSIVNDVPPHFGCVCYFLSYMLTCSVSITIIMTATTFAISRQRRNRYVQIKNCVTKFNLNRSNNPNELLIVNSRNHFNLSGKTKIINK